MAENKPEEIKVIDRRMFNPDGSLRDDVLIEETSAPAPEPARAAEAAPEPGPEGEPEMNEFMEFLMQLASSAFIYLGMMEHPATGTRQVNLPAARQSIDMLVMLREKTKGNLTRDEERFFEGLLSDLQMQFVALSNRATGGMQGVRR
ncbi:MAG TPA: DUF1844 domain-containing protein [Blastocatellia bacterium]|nr:DUF1844 domain-containing protein [Blastocatellia bacterium]